MRGAREISIGLGGYVAYLAVRRAVWHPTGRRRAHANARRIIEIEHRLGIDIEPAVQRRAMRHPNLVRALNVGYAAGNVALSVGWLISLYRRSDPAFPRERRAATIAFAGALPFFLGFATAPPRTQDEFVDTLADRGVDLEHPFLVRFYNPIAAMPSHHVAFAVVTGVGLAARRGHLVGRVAWRSYPVGVATIVIGTGNHYVLDVMAGAILGGVARWLSH